jgi:N-acetylmuramoyl-L-alanine amidase/putative methionine-R-sulfoxide reductase with GAF domain
MSATPNNAGAAWGAPPFNGPPDTGLGESSGHDALQALLAFASIQQQASKRKSQGLIRKEDELALDEVLRLVAARALSITGADGVAIALAQENAIVCRASLGSIAPPPGVRLDPSSGFSGACLRSGQTVRCDDSETDERVNARACRDLGTRSMIAVPLSAKQRVVGLIEAFSSEPFGFNESDVRSLNLLGELILAAIRPEEEDRLAQLAERVVPAPVSASASAPATQAAVSETAAHARQELIQPKDVAEQPDAAPAAENAESKSEVVATASIEAAAKSVVDEKPAATSFLGKTESNAEIAATASPATTAAKAIVEKERTPAPTADKPDPAKFISIVSLPEPKLDLRAVPLEAPGSRLKEERRLPGILLTATLVLVAIGLGWAVVWKAKHVGQPISANTRVPSAKATTAEIVEPDSTPVPEAKSTSTPQVTGIRHWSSAQSSTVVVDLDDTVQYEVHSIADPARIYLDLNDTKMGPGLLNQSIAVNDAFLKRVRMAQPRQGVTRVVLETVGDLEPSVKLDSHQLTIEVHKISSPSLPSNLGKPSPAIAATPKRKASTSAGDVGPSALRIVLDAGHGGWDLGTVGKKGLLEKDLVFVIVQRLGQMLEEKLGAEVIYTRQDDSYIPLEKRAEIANVARADLFLSVHANYSDLATARGVETYYTQTYSSVKARTSDDLASLKEVNWTGVDIREKVTGSHRFAADIQQALYGGLASQNPDLRNRGVKEAQYVVLTGTQMPAVLAEVSFVSSPEDESKLQSSEYRQQIAEALYKGVVRYRRETKQIKVAKVSKSLD